MVDFRILVVEHDDESRELMMQTLSASFHTTVVKTGAEALEIVSSVNPDLVLIDFQLHDISSVEVQQTIAKTYPQVHTVMITNVDRSKISLHSMKKRAMDYIYRSIDSERFMNDICKLVRWLIDMKYTTKRDQELVASGFYDLAKKLYEEKKWTAEEIQKILEERVNK